MTTFDQFVLHLAMQLLGESKIFHTLREQQTNGERMSTNENLSRISKSTCYWRSRLKHHATTMMTTTSSDDCSNSQPFVYFLDITFDFSSTSSPLAIFGVLLESPSSSDSAVYVKSSPFTFSQWKHHFDHIGVDVDLNDARDVANSMAQSLIFEPVQNVALTTTTTTTLIDPTSAEQESTAMTSNLLTIDILYHDLDDTGHLQLDVQQSSVVDATLLEMIVSNASSADELIRQSQHTSSVEHHTSDNDRKLEVVQDVLDLWQQRVERLRVMSEKDNRPEPVVVVATDKANESSSTKVPLKALSKPDAAPESTASSAAAPSPSATPSAAENDVAPNDVPDVVASSNNGKTTVVVRRVVAKKAAHTKASIKKRRREVGGKLTYANNS